MEIKIKRKVFSGELPRVAIFLLICILLACSQVGYAKWNPLSGMEQQKTAISGKVMDSSNEPLAGVTVVIKGTTTGTVTDVNGGYSIEAAPGDVLIFSFVGMKNQEVTVGAEKTINITLASDTQDLDEVVVIGYGSVKKKDLTGSVATVNVSDMNKVRINDPIVAIQGQISGVNVTKQNGAPGENKNVTIRGYHTLNNNEPLYIIDGVAGNLNYVNPDDIESISVLKDAAAASIYGTRAAGGVIIVTTKRGKKGEPQITFSTDYGFQKVTKFWEMCNSEEYLKIHTAIKESADLLPDEWAVNYNDYANTDWQKEMYRVAPMKKYNLSVASGTDNSSIFVSTAYSKEDGVIIRSGFEKFSLNVNSDMTKGRWKFGESVSVNRNIQNSLGTSGGYGTSYDLVLALPHMRVFNDQNNGGFGGAVSTMPDVKNPVGSAKLQTSKGTTDYISSRFYSELEIIKGLKYKINGGYNITNFRYFYFRPSYFMSDVDQEDLSYLREDSRRTSELILENTLTYDKVIDNHSINLLLGYTVENKERRTIRAEGYNTPTNDITVLNAVQEQKNVDGLTYTRRLVSNLARLTYSYSDKYLLTGTIRRDGSSQFGSDYRYGNFPSIALGWKISNEDFFNKDFINDLKLRASWGMLGTMPYLNNDERDYYLPQSTVTGGLPYVFPGSGLIYGMNLINPSNKELKWESTTSRNIGLDMQLLKNRIGVSAEYYLNTTKDIIVGIPIPFTNGTPSFWETNTLAVNAGDIETKGYEFSLNLRNSESVIKYDITANISYNKVLVTSMGTDTTPNPISGGLIDYNGGYVTRTEKKHSIGELYVYQADGLFQSQAEIDSYVGPDGVTPIQPDAAPGDVKFKDVNHDGIIDDRDMAYSGQVIPKFEFNLNFNLRYKNFDLALYLQGVQGNKIFNGLKYMTETVTGYKNYSKSSLNFWTPQNTNTDIPRPTADNLNNNSRASTRFIENGSYLRLKNVQLGYSLPKNLVNKIHVENIRIYIGAYNLVTFTKYTGYDPEVGNDNIFSRGVDTGIYPVSKLFNYGLQIIF